MDQLDFYPKHTMNDMFTEITNFNSIHAHFILTILFDYQRKDTIKDQF